DAGYIPSLLDVAAAAPLASQLRDVHGLLHQRGDAPGTQMAQPGPGGIAEIAEFLWLKTINRFEPLFAHLAATTPLHPETLYAACLALAGELSTFTRDSRRPIAYPVYRHDDLAGSFGPVVADIRRSMSMVLERSAVPIDLQTRGSAVAHTPCGWRPSPIAPWSSPRGSCWLRRRSSSPSVCRRACRRS